MAEKKNFSNFSKATQYFFLIILGPLRRLIKTYFDKKIQKKIEFYFCQKISQLFFLGKILAEKIKKLVEQFTKDFPYKIFIKGFPL